MLRAERHSKAIIPEFKHKIGFLKKGSLLSVFVIISIIAFICFGIKRSDFTIKLPPNENETKLQWCNLDKYDIMIKTRVKTRNRTLNA